MSFFLFKFPAPLIQCYSIFQQWGMIFCSWSDINIMTGAFLPESDSSERKCIIFLKRVKMLEGRSPLNIPGPYTDCHSLCFRRAHSLLDLCFHFDPWGLWKAALLNVIQKETIPESHNEHGITLHHSMQCASHSADKLQVSPSRVLLRQSVHNWCIHFRNRIGSPPHTVQNTCVTHRLYIWAIEGSGHHF